ncbi:uncharacterized protein LOC143045389 [Mytilus galloprovincialis]|uniref:uncharacterized protein LOC143045389 n=1 Tax=Mytilus galloprovincialis TaxID=29158 RepID=UPI003F7BE98E
MKTKSKRVETVEDSDGEIVVKKPKLSSLGRRKKHGDKLGTVELSNEDGFTTDEEEDEIEGQYEGCKHFEVESKHIKGIQTKKIQVKNIQERVKTPVSSKKRKTLKKRTMKIKVKVKVKNKPGTVKVRLEDTAKLVKKKKILKQKKEMKKLLDIESSSKDDTKLQRSKLEDKVQKDASHVVIKTDNVSNNKEQEKLEETDVGNTRKKGRPGKIKVEKVEQNENLSNRGTQSKVQERKRKSQETDPLIDTRKKKEQSNVEDDKTDLHFSISEGKTEKLDVEGKESNKSLGGKKKKAERRIKKVASVEVVKTENISENGKQQESLEEEILNVRKSGRPSKIKVEKVEGNENLSSQRTETKVKEKKGTTEKTNQEADPIIVPPQKGENKNIDDDTMDLPLSISVGKTVKLGVDVEEKESNKSIQENKKKAEERKKQVASDEVIQTENISDDVKQPESRETEIVNAKKRGRPRKIKVEKVEGNENLSSQGTETKVKEKKGTTKKTNQEADPIIDPPQKGENKNIDDDTMDLPLSISVGKTVKLGVDVEEKESNKSLQENKKKAEERKKKVASDEIIQTENISDDVKQPKSQETEIVNMRKRGRPTKIKVEKVEQNENVSRLGTEIKVKERKRKGEKSNQEPFIETRKEEENPNVDDKINLPLSISVGKTEKFNVEVDKKEANKSFQGKGKKGEECVKKDAADDLIKTENISDDVKQLKSLAKEIVNARKRGRPSKIKVEKVEENENAVCLGTESKVQERKGKGEKTNQEADPIIDLPKKEENKNINDDDKISISKGKTEKIGGNVQEKGSNKSVQGKKEKAEERKKKVVTDDVIKTENISDIETQGKLEEIEIVNVRKRGRPSKIKIKVEKVEENKNISHSSLGTETKIKERKIKGEKTIKETDTDTRKKEKNTNIDDKIDLHHSISDGKTEKSDVDVEGKESNESFKGKKKKDGNTDNREKDTRPNSKEKKKKSEEVVVDERRLDPNQEKFVGAHVSIAGGIYKSVLEAVAMKSFAFGLFLKSQRQWACKPLEDEAAEKFRKTCQEYGYLPQYIVPHGSYLMNLGSPDENTLHKSRDLLIDDLQRCEKLGLTIFNFHPGSTCGKISVEKCLDNIAASIDIAHSKTSGVITVLENMSCQGHTIGGKFEELKGIIDRVKDKSRMGVCLDTCHAFAAGFDLSTEEGFNQMLSDFESIVGFQYLKALHINDSKGKLGCHLDRHENIGKGHIGKAGFNRIMNCPRFNHIPMILETPCADNDSYAKEVEMLYTMCNT